ncbi:hypothetical protein DAPPUDRAFT_331913 [Daphnia pulex]|uniref:Uncharacterized protein n=1 Tax=Daphnia pulex TaxID=6669 RepID=E9HNT3_DAPPU|nr:hypothetical protein DAPPUDRAFT_331913 [Daphnia pulex]|eukprot:EFX66615.1 hypothetical protein DAPPUDRAFT_331913 [Daphnia pulex]
MSELPHEQPGQTKVGKNSSGIRCWRLSVPSAIAFIEEKFNAGFDFVLTGKWNQDPLERRFGIIRSVNSNPSVTSWLQIIQYVTLQSRLNTARRNANIDDDEGVECLVSQAKCLKKQAKELDVLAATVKCFLKEELLE